MCMIFDVEGKMHRIDRFSPLLGRGFRLIVLQQKLENEKDIDSTPHCNDKVAFTYKKSVDRQNLSRIPQLIQLYPQAAVSYHSKV